MQNEAIRESLLPLKVADFPLSLKEREVGFFLQDFCDATHTHW